MFPVVPQTDAAGDPAGLPPRKSYVEFVGWRVFFGVGLELSTPDRP